MKPAELKDFLKRHDINAEHLAKVLGVTWQAVDHWLNGRREINETMKRLIAMFDNDPEDMEYFESFASADSEHEH